MGNEVNLTYIADWPNSGKHGALTFWNDPLYLHLFSVLLEINIVFPINLFDTGMFSASTAKILVATDYSTYLV